MYTKEQDQQRMVSKHLRPKEKNTIFFMYFTIDKKLCSQNRPYELIIISLKKEEHLNSK